MPFRSILTRYSLLLLAIGCSEPLPLGQNRDSSPTGSFDDPLPAGAMARIGTTRLRHPADVVSVAVSPNGNLVASGAAYPAPSIRVWEMATGAERFRIENQDYYVAISPDGNMLATAGAHNGNRVRLWEMTTGSPLKSFKIVGDAEGRVDRIDAVAFLPDGQSIAVKTAHVDARGMPEYPHYTTVRIVDLATGDQVHRLRRPDDVGHSFSHFCFSPDGQWWVLYGAQQPSAALWNLKTGEFMEAFGASIRSAEFSADGRQLALAGLDTIAVIDFPSRKERCVIRGFHPRRGGPGPIALSPNGNLVAAGEEYSPDLRVWSARTGRLVRAFERYRGERVACLTFAPDSRTLVTAEGMTIRARDVITGIEPVLGGIPRRPLAGAVFSPDSRILALCGNDPGVRLHDGTTFRLLRRFATDEPIRSIAFSPNGKLMATAGNHLRLWTTTGRLLQTYHRRTTQGTDLKVASCVAFLPTGDQILSSSYDGVLRVWNIDDHQPVRELPLAPPSIVQGQGLSARYFALIPGTQRVAVYTDQWKVIVLDYQTGEQFTTFDAYLGHDSRRPIAVSADGTRIAGAVGSGNDSYVLIRDLFGDQPGIRLDPPKDRRWSLTDVALAFSPDGRLLATGSRYDDAVSIWDATTGEHRRYLAGHSNGIPYLDFSHDGKWLASASSDGTVMVWDMNEIRKTTSGLLLGFRLERLFCLGDRNHQGHAVDR